MKKLFAVSIMLIIISVMCFTSIFSVSAEIKEEITTWLPWVQDGKEITLGEVTTNESGFVKELSSNWAIKAQDSQAKITETYMSPATVWTVDTNEDFEFVWEINGGDLVQIGFLHCVGAGATVTPVDREGTQLYDLCKLYWSADGESWEVAEFEITPSDETLISGLTGYDKVSTSVGNGVDEYSEDYFIISGTMNESAEYVKIWYEGNSRSNSWDPCIRDAVFTSYEYADESQDTSEPSESSETTTQAPTTPTGDMGLISISLITVIALAATVIVKKAR